MVKKQSPLDTPREVYRELIIRQLRVKGRQTRLQMLRAGMSRKQIESFVECGILVSELDPATNLYYLSVTPDDRSS